MHEYKTKKYVDKLHDFLNSYNSSKHVFFKKLFSPNEARLEKNNFHILDIHNQFYQQFLKKRKIKMYKIGDRVRVKKWRNPFSKGYRQKFSDEIFQIVSVNPHLPIPMYKIKSTGNAGFERFANEEPIIGKFYYSDLSLVQ